MRYKIKDLDALKAVVRKWKKENNKSGYELAELAGLKLDSLYKITGGRTVPQKLIDIIPEIKCLEFIELDDYWFAKKGAIISNQIQGKIRGKRKTFKGTKLSFVCRCGQPIVQRGQCKECFKRYKRNAMRIRRNNIKKALIQLKGGKCEKCGIDQFYMLCFHHPNKDKEFMICKSYDRPFELLKKEVMKCQLLCLNHHAEEHYQLNNN